MNYSLELPHPNPHSRTRKIPSNTAEIVHAISESNIITEAYGICYFNTDKKNILVFQMHIVYDSKPKIIGGTECVEKKSHINENRYVEHTT